MRRCTPLLAVAMVFGASTACSVLVSLDGLSGGGETVAGADAADDGADDGSADVGHDAPADADGAVDAADAALVDAGPCVAPGLTTRVCDDFERTSLLGNIWDSYGTNNGAAISILSDTPSSERVLRAVAPDFTTGFAQAFISVSPPIATRAHYAFDLKYDALPASGFRQIATIKVAGPYQVYLAATQTGFTLTEQIVGDSSADHPLVVTSPLPNTWTRVSIDLDLSADTVTLLIDGVSPFPKNEVFTKIQSFSGTQVTFAIGLRYAEAPSAAMALSADHVFIATD